MRIVMIEEVRERVSGTTTEVWPVGWQGLVDDQKAEAWIAEKKARPVHEGARAKPGGKGKGKGKGKAETGA